MMAGMKIQPSSPRIPAVISFHSRATASRVRPLISALALGMTLACNPASGEGPADADGKQTQAAEAPRVEVFVTDWCPYCQRLEAFLKENKVSYERKNIEQNADARAEHAALGGGGIPVTRIAGDQVVRGYRPDVIAKLLDLEVD